MIDDSGHSGPKFWTDVMMKSMLNRERGEDEARDRDISIAPQEVPFTFLLASWGTRSGREVAEVVEREESLSDSEELMESSSGSRDGDDGEPPAVSGGGKEGWSMLSAMSSVGIKLKQIREREAGQHGAPRARPGPITFRM